VARPGICDSASSRIGSCSRRDGTEGHPNRTLADGSPTSHRTQPPSPRYGGDVTWAAALTRLHPSGSGAQFGQRPRRGGHLRPAHGTSSWSDGYDSRVANIARRSTTRCREAGGTSGWCRLVDYAPPLPSGLSKRARTSARRRQAESSKRCHVREPPRHSRSKLHYAGGRREVPRTEWQSLTFNIQPGGFAHFFTVWVGLSIGAPRLCIRWSEPVICSRHAVWLAPVLPPLAGVRPGHSRWRGLRHRMGVQKGLGCRQSGRAGAARRPARAVARMAEAAPIHDQSAVARLERAEVVDPRLSTLVRYASMVGLGVSIG